MAQRGLTVSIPLRSYCGQILRYAIRFAYQTGGFRGKALLSLFPQCSRSLIYEHINRPLNEQQQVADKRKYNKGVTKITSQNERNIVRTVKRLRESDGTFTSRCDTFSQH